MKLVKNLKKISENFERPAVSAPVFSSQPVEEIAIDKPLDDFAQLNIDNNNEQPDNQQTLDSDLRIDHNPSQSNTIEEDNLLANSQPESAIPSLQRDETIVQNVKQEAVEELPTSQNFYSDFGNNEQQQQQQLQQDEQQPGTDFVMPQNNIPQT